MSVTDETSKQNLVIGHVYFGNMGTGTVETRVEIALKICTLLSAATLILTKGISTLLARAKDAPNVGLEPTTLGLRVPCSTD